MIIFVINANSRLGKFSLTLNNVTRFSKSFSISRKALKVVDGPAAVPKGETINVGAKDDVSDVKESWMLLCILFVIRSHVHIFVKVSN